VFNDEIKLTPHVLISGFPERIMDELIRPSYELLHNDQVHARWETSGTLSGSLQLLLRGLGFAAELINPAVHNGRGLLRAVVSQYSCFEKNSGWVLMRLFSVVLFLETS